MNPRIIADANSLKVRVGGPATANICLLINGQEFPASGWNDFAVVVLSWWVKSMLVLLQDENSVEKVDFMEGPFTVEVSRPLPYILRLAALTGAARAQQNFIAETEIQPFILGLIEQSRDVLAACRRQSWWSSDAQSLESSLVNLKKAVLKLPHENGDAG